MERARPKMRSDTHSMRDFGGRTATEAGEAPDHIVCSIDRINQAAMGARANT